MSDIPGVSSKYNTTKLVEDLVNAERLRLTKMEDQVSSLEKTRTTWRQLNRILGDLQRSVKSLYGFENPFADKNAVSSNDRILTAAASRTAPLDTYSVDVKQVARSDRFLTPSLDRSFRVDKGTYTFEVGKESLSLQYRGGTLEDFAKRITDKGEGLVRATTVRDTSNTQVMMIEAIPTGQANRLVFLDDARTFSIQTGMMQVARVDEGRVTPEQAVENAVTAKGEPAPSNTVLLREDAIQLHPSASLRIPFDEASAVGEGMILEYQYQTVEMADTPPQTPPGPDWPAVPDGSYRGVVVESSPNSFILPPSSAEREPPVRKDDWDVLSVEGAASTAALPSITPSDEFQTVRVAAENLPGDIQALVLENRNTHRSIAIRGIRLYDPSRAGDLKPVQPAGIAADAVIEFRGIEVRRPSNTIDDLLDGLTLNLKRPSDDAVELKVEPDVEVAKEGLVRFVFSYNQLLTRILVLTTDNTAVVDELEYLNDEERSEMEEMLGTLRGDVGLNQLKSRLQNIVANPYPVRSDSGPTLLAQIGISTNASSGQFSGSLDFSRLRGYLEIDEEKLTEALARDIDAVKDLFGMDTTGDLVINSGVAQVLDEYLTPYTQSGGFLSTRLSGIAGQIERTEDDIADYEEYLDDYEADLKRQYGNMEAILNQLENSSRELDNFNRQQGDR